MSYQITKPASVIVHAHFLDTSANRWYIKPASVIVHAHFLDTSASRYHPINII